MTLNQQKEQLSVAYVHAVASAAGCSVKDVRLDDDSVDLTIVSTIAGTELHAPELNIQLKATSQEVISSTDISFPLKLKNYQDLVKKTLVPRILVVMIVPEEPDRWLRQTDFKTHIYRCAYWKSLWGMPKSANSTSVTITLSRSNVLTPGKLSSIMSTIANGGRP